MPWADGDKLTPNNLNTASGLVYNVKDADYGATGDGSTDDTTAIQAAVSAVSVADGGTLFFPPGTYVTSAEIVSNRSNFHVLGSGMGTTTIKLAAGSDVDMWSTTSGNTNVTFEHLTFDGNKANQAANGDALTLIVNTNVIVRSVEIKNSWKRGIFLFQCVDSLIDGCYLTGIGGTATSDGTNAGIVCFTTTRARVVNNHVDTCNDSCILCSTTAVETTIANNLVKGANFIGIALGSSGTNGTVTGNVVLDCTDNAIDVGSVTGGTVTGNTTENCGGGIIGDGCAQVTVTGNTVVGTTGTNTGGRGSGVDFLARTTADKDLTVFGNTISACEGSGIWVDGYSEVIIGCNLCKNNGTGATQAKGIRIVGTSLSAITGVLVIGNRCYDDAGSPVQEYGVSVENVSGVVSDVLIVNNDLRDNNTAPLLFTNVGANVLARDNRLVDGEVQTLDDTGTPSVLGGHMLTTGGTTSITDFDDGEVGQEIIILGAHSVTITDGAPIILAGGANMTMVASDTLTLRMFDDQVWQETSRSVN